MIPKATQQVSPKVTAAVILILLIAIQVVWWRGLVMKSRPGPGGGGGGGGGGPGGPPTLVGRKDVRVDTLAGAVEPGDADGPGHQARFDTPIGLAVDSQGSLYVADSRNNRIRRITPQGRVTTLAGGEMGYQDGPAAQAKFALPGGVAVGPDGAVYVADTGNHRIRVIKAGQVTTLAGGEPGMADGQGSAVRFHSPTAVAYVQGAIPGLSVADAENRRVRLLDLSGKTRGGWSVPGAPTAILAAGLVAVPQVSAVCSPRETRKEIPIDMQDANGNQAEFTLHRPFALCPAPNGWFVIDTAQCGVFLVQSGKAELLAGHSRGRLLVPGWHDGDGHVAVFGQLSGIAADGRGHLYVSDTSNNCIRKLTLPQEIAGESPQETAGGREANP
jgi:hypothetical protein